MGSSNLTDQGLGATECNAKLRYEGYKKHLEM